MNSDTKKGFTLIELLVVIGIITVLAGVVFAAITEVRKQSRDRERMTDLKEIELALELYKEANGEYPPECPPDTSPWAGHPSVSAAWGRQCTNYIDGLVPVFMSALPVDPNPSLDNVYLYRTDGQEYKLIAHRTVESEDVDYEHAFARCPSGCGGNHCQNDSGFDAFDKTYAIYYDANPGDMNGSECW